MEASVVDVVVVSEDTKMATAEEARNHELADCVINAGAETQNETVFAIDESVKSKNRIQVSNTKKPLIFYLKLAKKYMKLYNDVELCALGMAIPTVVMISEKLKRNGLAIEKNIMTSTISSKEDKKGRVIQKAKIEIHLERAGEMEHSTIPATLKKVSQNMVQHELAQSFPSI